MKLDAVIFDMDGTITDTEKYYNRTWPLAFAACGYSDFTRDEASTTKMRKSFGKTATEKTFVLKRFTNAIPN